MLSQESLTYIAKLFIGDIESLYSYKTGPKIISFFNQYFNYTDVYEQGFPSRWLFTYNKLVELFNSNQFERFINIILSKSFLMRDGEIDEISAIEKANVIVKTINQKIKLDNLIIIKRNDKYFLIDENEDLILIGSGGFCNVYKRKSNKEIIKKLKDDFIMDNSIRSRFKREFTITKSLSDIPGIIKVYEYFEDNCSYTMEEAETTLNNYILEYDLQEKNKITCIRQILNIMKIVHERDIIHRDLSPNNILIVNGMLKISDFGLGKDLNIFNSHQTLYTNALGQYSYCAPEQFMLLKDGNKRSDVYSLGRIINFILTRDPNNNHHFLRSVVEKATSQNPAFRYSNASKLLEAVEKSIKYHESETNKQEIRDFIMSGILNENVESYIYELGGEELCKKIMVDQNFKKIIICFIGKGHEKAEHIIENIVDNYQNVCKSLESWDPFAEIAYLVIKDDFPYYLKELAAGILAHIAYEINRYNAQNLIKRLKEDGLEPSLEEILE